MFNFKRQRRSYWQSRFDISKQSAPTLFKELVVANVLIREIVKDERLAIIRDDLDRLWVCQPADTLGGFVGHRPGLNSWLVPIYGPVNPAIASKVMEIAERNAA